MIIWDSGTFAIDRSEVDLPAADQLENGNLKLIFHGNKIKGRFALVRTGLQKEKEHWLLIKKKDAFASEAFYDAETMLPTSAIKTRKYPKKIKPGEMLGPMLASPSKEIFNDPNWLYELKWDGYRVLAHLSGKGVLLQSRNGINYNSKFASLAEELEQVRHETILDGEVVILNEEGISVFGELQNYPDSRGELRFYVFDMLYLNGHSMLDLPLSDRKSLIPEVLEDLQISRYCDHIEGMGAALYNQAIEVGMEGVMAKKMDSTYTPGARTENWLKIKAVADVDALICGYTDSVNGGAAFGSLILGAREKDTLTYIGNCGSGFSEDQRNELLQSFETYRTEKNPFAKKLPLKGRKPNWMVPELICEVKYSEKTDKGLLRNPVFKRLKSHVDHPHNHPKNIQRKIRPITGKGAREILEIDGLPVVITNLEKTYWPESGMTKYDLIDYYLKISEVILPHLKDRPQSLHRHPSGIHGESFYQKDNESVPEWMRTATLYSKSSARDIEYLLCQNTASLIHMANLGCIEINPWNSRTHQVENPDYGIIDLDPPEGTAFEKVIQVAQNFEKILNATDLTGFCKTSGSKGLHIYLPMAGNYSYAEVRNFIKLLCYFVQQNLPDITTMERHIKKREGKIYLDYLQNRKGQTVAAAYSVRPVPGAQVSAPVTWQELGEGITPADFTMSNMPDRIAQKGDLFAKVLKEAIDMEAALERLENNKYLNGA